MGSNVRQTIRHLMSNAEGTGKQVRFSISVDEIDDRKLEFIAKKLKLSKSKLVSTLLKAAIDDIEGEMGLDKDDSNSAYARAIWAGEEMSLDDYKV